MDPGRPVARLRIDHSGGGRGHYHCYRSTTSMQGTENGSDNNRKSHQEDDACNRYANSYGQHINCIEEEEREEHYTIARERMY